MELSNQQTLPVDQDEAWTALNDIPLLQSCIPGCESITPTGDNSYDVALMAAIGPVKARFKGKLTLADLKPPSSYALQFEAQGGAAGHGKGTASVTLTPVSDAETLLAYSVQASVGGKVAQIGSRLVDMAAQKMANEFFNNFNAKLKERHPSVEPVSEEGKASTGMFSKVKGLFGGGKE